jgi:DNA-binding LacI/PurR family transcriptional regulator
LPYEPALVLNMGDHDRLDNDQLAVRIAELRQQGVTAWVSATDRAAYEVLYRLCEHGVSVPKDVSIVGFDAIETPPGLIRLVSAAPPLREIGATALRRLLTRCHHPASPVRSVLLECAMADGQSVGDGPAGALHSLSCSSS